MLISVDLVTAGRRCAAGAFWFTPTTTRRGPHETITNVALITVRFGPMGASESVD